MTRWLTIAAVGLVILVAASPPKTTAATARYPLGTNLAEHYMRIGLSRHFDSWPAGYAKVVRCTKRVSRDRVRCQYIQWIVGDVGFYGHGTLWVTYERGVPHWNYSYRIVELNEYCADVEPPGTDCTRVHVVR